MPPSSSLLTRNTVSPTSPPSSSLTSARPSISSSAHTHFTAAASSPATGCARAFSSPTKLRDQIVKLRRPPVYRLARAHRVRDQGVVPPRDQPRLLGHLARRRRRQRRLAGLHLAARDAPQPGAGRVGALPEQHLPLPARQLAQQRHSHRAARYRRPRLSGRGARAQRSLARSPSGPWGIQRAARMRMPSPPVRHPSPMATHGRNPPRGMER